MLTLAILSLASIIPATAITTAYNFTLLSSSLFPIFVLVITISSLSFFLSTSFSFSSTALFFGAVAIVT
jgi:hypothetical protein